MRDLQAEFPFALVADPEKTLYAAFGVVRKISAASALQPRTFKAAARALTSAPSLRGATGKGEEHRMLPADFLIDTDGRLLAAHYGRFVDDHWSVDDLLELVRTARPRRRDQSVDVGREESLQLVEGLAAGRLGGEGDVVQRSRHLRNRHVAGQAGGASPHPFDVEDHVGLPEVGHRARVSRPRRADQQHRRVHSRPRSIRACPVRTARIQPA